MAAFAPLAASYPSGFAWWLVAADLAAYPIDEVAIVGGPGVDADRRSWRSSVAASAPVSCWLPPRTALEPSSIVPLLRDRPLVEGQATAYVCRGFTCQAPTTSPDALAGQLGA